MPSDPALQTLLTNFLQQYHRAVETSDPSFLTAHTTFPLPFESVAYDKEAKSHSGQIASVEALLAAIETLRWPDAVVPKDPSDLIKLRRGIQKCNDPKAPELPDFSQGDAAIEQHGEDVALTYLAQPCEAETHLVTLHFARSGTSWRLVKRTVKMGRR